MADNCQACQDLNSYAPNFLTNGVTQAICESLGKNTGLIASNNHINAEDMQDVIDCLVCGFKSKIDSYGLCAWDQAAKELVDNLCKIFTAYNCELAGIWIRLEELYQLILAIQSGNYTRMVKGRDYNIQFYNGWLTIDSDDNQTDDLYVGYINALGQWSIRIQAQNGSTNLVHRNMSAGGVNNVEMRHNTAPDDATKSIIYGIDFIGDFAALNNYTYIGASGRTAGSGVWNLRPTNGRMSWQAVLQLNKNVAYTGMAYTQTWASYVDGYNTQLSVYNDMGIVTGTISCVQANHLFDFFLRP